MLKRVGFWHDTSCLLGIQLGWTDGKTEQYGSAKGS